MARSGGYAKARDLCALTIDAYQDSGDHGPRHLAVSNNLARWAMLATGED